VAVDAASKLYQYKLVGDNNHVLATSADFQPVNTNVTLTSQESAQRSVDSTQKIFQAVLQNDAGIPPVAGTRFTRWQSDASHRYYINLHAANGEIVLAGCGGAKCGYSSKAAADNGIASIKQNATSASAFQKQTAKDGSAYFVLTAGNGQVIGKSQMYSSASARDAGIQAVIRAVSGSPKTEDIAVHP
jgi:uncharacterized protein YegP (UPF0339 family)